MRFLSVCSGIEAASAAWNPLGWRAVGVAEIDRNASRVLAHHHPDVPNFGDFTTIDVSALGPVDLLVGGTPCQAFSHAGRRLSLADARGNLSLAYAVLAHELVRVAGLRWAVWENVPGVLSTDDNAFGCLLAELVGASDPLPLPGRLRRWPNAGMVAGPRARAAWRVLDSQYFGLAQRRKRVFLVVGFGARTDPAAVLFEPQGLRRHPPSRGKAEEGIAAPLTAGPPRGSGYRNDADTTDNLIVEAPLAFGGNDTRGPLEVSTTLNAHGGPTGRLDFESETFVCFDPRQADVLIHGDVTGPLDTKFPGSAIASRVAVRRLMPIEHERLQGFPEGHTAIPGAADGPRYKQLGNSKSLPPVLWLGERIAAQEALAS